MEIITLDVDAAKTILGNIHKALKPLALDNYLSMEGCSDRDARCIAEVLRESILEFEEARLAAGRKAKASTTPIGDAVRAAEATNGKEKI